MTVTTKNFKELVMMSERGTPVSLSISDAPLSERGPKQNLHLHITFSKAGPQDIVIKQMSAEGIETAMRVFNKVIHKHEKKQIYEDRFEKFEFPECIKLGTWAIRNGGQWHLSKHKPEPTSGGTLLLNDCVLASKFLEIEWPDAPANHVAICKREGYNETYIHDAALETDDV